jgi:cell division protein FtsN
MPGRKVGGPAIADGANGNGNNDVIATSSDPNGTFWVVAGSFNDQKNAIEQQVKLMNKGLQETTVEYVDNIRFYRVVVSKQISMDAAAQTARSIKNKGISNLFVVKK